MKLNVNVKTKKPKIFSEISIGKKKAGHETFKSEKFGNKITDFGLEKIHYTYNATLSAHNYSGKITAYMSVSTGTSDIVSTDIGLAGTAIMTPMSLGTSNVQTVNIEGVDYARIIFAVNYALGAVVGNLGQVGIFFSNNNTTMLFGTRIKDGSGIPTTIPVASDEQLFVEYTIYVEITSEPNGYDVINNAGIITLDGVDYPYNLYFNRRVISSNSIYFVNPGNSNWVYRYLASTTPAGSINRSTQATTASSSLDSVNKTATYNATYTISPSDGELYISALVLQNNTGSQFNYSNGGIVIEFQNRIPKTALESLTFDLQVTTDWSGT